MNTGHLKEMHGPPVSLDVARELDAICDEFESAWKDGIQPDIDSYLGRTSMHHQHSLLVELINVDVHYRRLQGESAEPDDYGDRFRN